MQREVDAIIAETLECYDDGAIEEEELAAFGLVLELFNHAIVERRAALQTATLQPPRRGGRPQPHTSTMTKTLLNVTCDWRRPRFSLADRGGP